MITAFATFDNGESMRDEFNFDQKLDKKKKWINKFIHQMFTYAESLDITITTIIITDHIGVE